MVLLSALNSVKMDWKPPVAFLIRLVRSSLLIDSQAVGLAVGNTGPQSPENARQSPQMQHSKITINRFMF